MKERESTNVNTGMNKILELTDKDFNEVIIKMILQAITSSSVSKLKNQKLSAKIRSYNKKEPNGNYRTKKQSKRKTRDGLNSRVKMTKDKNLNKRENRLKKDKQSLRYMWNNDK